MENISNGGDESLNAENAVENDFLFQLHDKEAMENFKKKRHITGYSMFLRLRMVRLLGLNIESCETNTNCGFSFFMLNNHFNILEKTRVS